MDIPTAKDIKKSRRERGLTQAQVAESAGVSQPLLSRIENEDIDPRLSTLHAVVSAINDHEPEIPSEELEIVLPQALRQLRTERGFTQRQLAVKSGLSQPMVARIETGDVDPRTSTFRSILDGLLENADEISTGSELSKEDGSSTEKKSMKTGGEEPDSGNILEEIETAFDSL